MMVKPFVGKAKIKDIINGYKIEIPAPRNWFVIIFMTAWLGGWAMGWFFAFTSIVQDFSNGWDGINFFLLFWLTGWTVGGAFVIKTLTWMILGKEIITIKNGQLEIIRKGDILSQPKSYDLNTATNFEVKKTPAFSYLNNSAGRNPWNNSSLGTLQFDYGMKTINFGIGIDEAEAKFLLEKFKSKNLIAG